MKTRKLRFWVLVNLFVWFFFINCQTSYSYTNIYDGPITIASERFPINIDGIDTEFPYYSNYPIDLSNSDIELLILSIHSSSPIAQVYLESAEIAANMTNKGNKTLIVAPQFFEYEEFEEAIPDNLLYWENTLLRFGSYRAFLGPDKQSVRISTFTVLDMMLEYVVESNLFPNIKTIVVLGHSAGGQMVNRYSASNLLENEFANSMGIGMKYLVMAPSSYLYLNEDRWKPNTFYQFGIPSEDSITDCTEYNDYGYGLYNLDYHYHTSNSIDADTIRQQFKNREVLYLVGSEDNDPDDVPYTGLSKTCESKMQGSERLERMTVYYEYLQHYYGPQITENQKKAIVQGVGHTSRDLMTSEYALDFIFSDIASEETEEPDSNDPESIADESNSDLDDDGGGGGCFVKSIFK